MIIVPSGCPKEQWKSEDPCEGIATFPHAVCCECRVQVPESGRALFPNGLLLPVRATPAQITLELNRQRVMVYPETKIRNKFTFPFFARAVDTKK
jgi:hypothetical protein